jgi:hypothetical protein
MKRGYLKSQNTRELSHPEFISGSNIQCVGILKQVQDDGSMTFDTISFYGCVYM